LVQGDPQPGPLGELNAVNLGYLIQVLEVQTAIAGVLYGVNVFD
jgi:glucose-6-phosphate isomerase